MMRRMSCVEVQVCGDTEIIRAIAKQGFHRRIDVHCHHRRTPVQERLHAGFADAGCRAGH